MEIEIGQNLYWTIVLIVSLLGNAFGISTRLNDIRKNKTKRDQKIRSGNPRLRSSDQ